jgi:hypothetical protein
MKVVPMKNTDALHHFKMKKGNKTYIRMKLNMMFVINKLVFVLIANEITNKY